ncbi:MAG: copper chaperone PCu(A)C [Caulobacterales bacterium]|nr:copper chaperone PCu(A)C [Caulobacterales bacterium]
MLPLLATLLVAASATAAAAAPATAAPATAAPVVSAAWSRPAGQGTTGGGYFTLTNPKGPADALVGVETPVAGMAMMHRSSTQGGVATMAMVDAVAVPKGATVTFAPGGYHLMFTDLKRPLKLGDSFPATLKFRSGAKVKATFVVGLAPPVAAASKR